jgi:hypothetical protein
MKTSGGCRSQLKIYIELYIKKLKPFLEKKKNFCCRQGSPVTHRFLYCGYPHTPLDKQSERNKNRGPYFFFIYIIFKKEIGSLYKKKFKK